MSITIDKGITSAKAMAVRDIRLYKSAENKFDSFITPYVGDVPRGFAVGHLLRVNHALLAIPPFDKNRRRGFMMASSTMASEAGIPWAQLDDALTCGYVWGRDINNDALTLYTTNTDLFTAPSVDFWRSAYLKHTLGDAGFKVIWGSRDTSQDTVYLSLLYAVNNLQRRIPGWNITQLKRTVFVDCEYVYQLAKQAGKLASDGYGIQPVIARNNMLEVYK